MVNNTNKYMNRIKRILEKQEQKEVWKLLLDKVRRIAVVLIKEVRKKKKEEEIGNQSIVFDLVFAKQHMNKQVKSSLEV